MMFGENPVAADSTRGLVHFTLWLCPHFCFAKDLKDDFSGGRDEN